MRDMVILPGIYRSRMRLVAVLVLGMTLVAGMAGAKAGSGLRNEADINDGLFVVAVADKIRRDCDAISPRIFRAYTFMNKLKDAALARGYSEDEIDAYINDDAEKAKMRERRNAYFRSKGASNLDPESLCALGRAEIAKDSRVGRLLRVW
jgi:hypothetical protein